MRMTWNNIRRIGPGKDIEAGMENQIRTGNRAMVLRTAAVVMCMWSLQLAAQVTSTTYADLDARKMVDASYATRSFMGAAAGFAIDGEFVWQYAVGLSDASDSTLFQSNTRTRIASIAKPMTAIATMQLVERGVLDLDVPVQIYLPEFAVKKEGVVTTRQLLQHTAGIGEYATAKERENQVHYTTLLDAIDIFKDRDLISVPGVEFNYSTYGYVLLGAIIEKVSGQTFTAYMQSHIWDVAGLQDTGVENGREGHAALYHSNDKGKISGSKITDLSDRIPGGGFYSTLTDLLKFGNAVLDGSLISAESLAVMLKDPGIKTDGNGYGLGWYLFGENPKYGNVFGHNGSQTGASTFLMLLPEQHTVVAVVSNTSNALPAVSALTVALFDPAAIAKAQR